MSDSKKAAPAVATPISAEDVLAKLGYSEFVRGLFNRSFDLAQDFTHGALGIVTEIGEYLYSSDPVNAIEEQGDLAFYEQALINLCIEKTGGFDIVAVEERISDLMVSCDEIGPQTVLDLERVELLDVCKRWIGYGKAPANLHEATVTAVALSRFAVTTMSFRCEDQNKVLLANVRKLLERYNGLGFNAERAVNRDTAAERSILETSAAE